MTGLHQKSESKGIAAMDLAIAVTGSWLSIELLDSLMWNGREQACVDSADNGFLRNVLRNALIMLWFLLLLW